MVEIDLLAHRSLLKVRKQLGHSQIWDVIRKRWLQITPEEMVRQLVIQHLLTLGFSHRLIQVEKKVLYEGMARRFDIVAYQKELIPFLLVECKAPNVPIDQAAFDQIAQYNMSLTVPFLWVTNGHSNYCCQMDYDTRAYKFFDHIPIALS